MKKEQNFNTLPEDFNRKAIGNKVIIKLDIVDTDLKKKGDVYMSKGGIAVSANTSIVDQANRLQEASETGIVISCGYMAFRGLGNGEPWARVGDRVGFKRYSGVDCTPHDSEIKYRCMLDEDLCFIEE